MQPTFITHFGYFIFAIFALSILQPSPNNGFLVHKDESTSQSPPLRRLCNDLRTYYNETRKCYLKGSKRPCAELMGLEEIEGSEFGKCVCDQTQCGNHPTVYWPEEKRCYFTEGQGPCPEGHWLIADKEEGAKCQNDQQFSPIFCLQTLGSVNSNDCEDSDFQGGCEPQTVFEK